MTHNLEQLTEIKKGQTGTGLLIEHDGHIIGNCDTVSQIREDISNGHKFVIPDNFVVSAVFQKYGIKNANGRIYPENVLKREVQKYLENQVANHRAVGSLDHPSCVELPDTLVLTKTGWKQICDIKVGEEVFSVTPNKKIEIKRVTKVINEPYKGKMINLKGRFIDLTVTPNHKFPVLDRQKEWKGFYTAQDLLDYNIPDQNDCSFFTINECENNNELFVVNIYEKSIDECQVLSDIHMSQKDYDGNVYCLEVEDNHTFYIMDKTGHCLWTGNSSTLSGHDVSHNILDLRWEGRTLVGEMKLHLSPGFKQYGICSTSGDLAASMILDGIQIGVSSRAVGSVEQKMGVLMVGDDLELVCWDIVLEPSTNGSWVAPNMKDLQQYIESEERSGNSMIEKINRIKNILGK